jgi:histidinol phosphatase-like PHP family hydrolase
MYDLHVHSNYSDGRGSIESIVRKAKEVGLKAIAIVDHSIEHRFGLTESKAKRRQEEIDKLSAKYNIEVLSGVECGIGANGEIALPAFKFDLVLASPHTPVCMEEYYRRIELCLKHHNFNVLSHFHSEIFGSIDGRDADRDAEIIDMLMGRDIALELNTTHRAPPEDLLAICSKRRVKYSVGSDSHSLNRIADVKWGFEMAKKYLRKGIFILER